MNIYAIVGDSFQQVGGDLPKGHIRMKELRPTLNHVAAEGGIWIIPVPTKEQIQLLRAEAYRIESDPLFMEWQYDETDETHAIWMDKVREIKLRYPLPNEAATLPLDFPTTLEED